MKKDVSTSLFLCLLLLGLPISGWANPNTESRLELIANSQAQHIDAIRTIDYAESITTRVHNTKPEDSILPEETLSVFRFRMEGDHWRTDSAYDVSGRATGSGAPMTAAFDGNQYQHYQADKQALIVDQKDIDMPYWSLPQVARPFEYAINSKVETTFRDFRTTDSFTERLRDFGVTVESEVQSVEGHECIVVRMKIPGNWFSDGKPKYRRVFFSTSDRYFPVMSETYFDDECREVGFRRVSADLKHFLSDGKDTILAMNSTESHYNEDGTLIITVEHKIMEDTLHLNEDVEDASFTVPKINAMIYFDKSNPAENYDLSNSSTMGSYKGLLTKLSNDSPEPPVQKSAVVVPQSERPHASGANATPMLLKLAMCVLSLCFVVGGFLYYILCRRQPETGGSQRV